MGYFRIESVKTILDAKDAMDNEWMNMICCCTTTAARKTTCKHMENLYKKFPELSTWWRYNPKEHYYEDVFIPRHRKKKYHRPVTGQLPKLELPCADATGLPEERGLYFIGMIGINPNETKYYLVKVGATDNIAKRVRQYGTYNPMIYIGGTVEDIDGSLSQAETNCHEYLADKAYAYAQNAREWFYVDEKTYYELCKTFANKEMFKAIAEGRD